MALSDRLRSLASKYLSYAHIQREGLPFDAVAIFGAGQRGRLISKYFKQLGARVLCFIDNNQELAHTKVDNIAVLPLAEAIAQFPNAAVYIASSHFHTIASQLQAAGIHHYYCMPLTSFYFYPLFYDENASDLDTVFDMLADQTSKDVYASIVKTYQSGDDGYLIISDYVQYQHPLVQFQDNDVIIDGGAFNGDTVSLIHGAVHPKKVISLEPTADIYEALARKCAAYGDNYICKKAGLWSSAAHRSFSMDKAAPYGNKITEHGAATIHCTTIDDLVKEYALDSVDLIKLDIEGAEEEALKGALQTITTFAPRLQISIYHNINDLFTLPLYIKRINKNYKFHVGHHAPDVHETILYCSV